MNEKCEQVPIAQRQAARNRRLAHNNKQAESPAQPSPKSSIVSTNAPSTSASNPLPSVASSDTNQSLNLSFDVFALALEKASQLGSEFGTVPARTFRKHMNVGQPWSVDMIERIRKRMANKFLPEVRVDRVSPPMDTNADVNVSSEGVQHVDISATKQNIVGKNCNKQAPVSSARETRAMKRSMKRLRKA